MNQNIEIPFSKTNVAILFMGSIGFMLLGISFLIFPQLLPFAIFSEPEIFWIIGIMSIVFFGVSAVLIAPKLFDRKAGLQINDQGIVDNTNLASIGLIEWDDIRSVKMRKVASARILMLLTDQPNKYIDKAKNGISKRTMQANYKMYGSPLAITASALQMNFADLEQLVLSELRQHRHLR